MARSRPDPDLDTEQDLARTYGRWIAGCDEVGRGALGGPVTVGVALIDTRADLTVPEALADSKLLTPRQRDGLVPRIERWAVSWGVGHASAGEIDARGLTAALRLAGVRAIAQLARPADAVLLDGRHDWLSAPPQSGWLDDDPGGDLPPVVTRVRADRQCASVAAASVLAKVARDHVMVQLAGAHPRYGWEVNKGYGAPAHLAALAEFGPCVEHRRTWRLPIPDVSQDTLRTSGPSRAVAGRLEG